MLMLTVEFLYQTLFPPKGPTFVPLAKAWLYQTHR